MRKTLINRVSNIVVSFLFLALATLQITNWTLNRHTHYLDNGSSTITHSHPLSGIFSDCIDLNSGNSTESSEESSSEQHKHNSFEITAFSALDIIALSNSEIVIEEATLLPRSIIFNQYCEREIKDLLGSSQGRAPPHYIAHFNA